MLVRRHDRRPARRATGTRLVPGPVLHRGVSGHRAATVRCPRPSGYRCALLSPVAPGALLPWSSSAAGPRQHADNRAQKGPYRQGTATRSLEGARTSPNPLREGTHLREPVKGRFAIPAGRPLTGPLRRKFRQLSGLGEGWPGGRTTSGCGHIGGATRQASRTPRSDSRPRRRSRISRPSCQVHAIELSRSGQIKLTAATGIKGRVPSPHHRSC